MFALRHTVSTQGHALVTGEAKNLTARSHACHAVGVSFILLVLETLGEVSVSAVNTLACLGHLLGQHLGVPPANC